MDNVKSLIRLQLWRFAITASVCETAKRFRWLCLSRISTRGDKNCNEQQLAIRHGIYASSSAPITSLSPESVWVSLAPKAARIRDISACSNCICGVMCFLSTTVDLSRIE